VRIGELPVRFASAHLMSKVKHYVIGHDTQTLETLACLNGSPGPVIWGGDLNTGLYSILGFEPSIPLILDAGYRDALANVPPGETPTHPGEFPIPSMRLDWIFFRDVAWEGGRVLRDPPLSTLSDHLGIYADFLLRRGLPDHP